MRCDLISSLNKRLFSADQLIVSIGKTAVLDDAIVTIDTANARGDAGQAVADPDPEPRQVAVCNYPTNQT